MQAHMSTLTKGKLKLRRVHCTDNARARIVKMLASGRTTYAQLREATGMKADSISRFVHELRRLEVCHIGDWEYDARNRPQVAVFVWGAGPDAKRPRLTRTQVNERQRMVRRAKRAAAKELDRLFAMKGR